MLRKLLILLGLCFSLLQAEDPEVLYLSWVGDPTTTMVVYWHTEKGEGETSLLLQKRGEANWTAIGGVAQGVSGTEVWVRRVELQGLEPNTEYLFRIGKEMEVHRFKTLPQTAKEPVQFVVGGDAYQLESLFHEMNLAIVKKNPDFIVVGGDIAYTNQNIIPRGKWWEIDRWRKFFSQWKQTMKTKEGRLIPIVPVVGNHDVPRGHIDPTNMPVMFYELFAFPLKGKSYRALHFGRYLQLLLLDTHHTWPVKGEQTEWLSQALNNRISWKIPIYHVAAYPSHYSYEARTSKQIRKWWVPLFEQNGVKLAFENHNHRYKRTFPLKGSKIDETGIVYFGDGSWGVPPRKSHTKHPYLAHEASINGCYLVTVGNDTCTVTPFTHRGVNVENPVMFSLKK